MVRGDSASVAPDPGAAPDSGRWYIERWVEAAPVTGAARIRPAAVEPAQRITLGAIKQLYR